MQFLSSLTHLGEAIALVVAASWTLSALAGEVAVRHLGAQSVNLWRMLLSITAIGLLLALTTGSFLPLHTDAATWGWLLLSGAVGYVFGDYCLFNAYALIGSRYAQLFITLAPAASAISAWAWLDQCLSLRSLLGMGVTMLGIGMSILAKGEARAPAAQPMTAEGDGVPEVRRRVALRLPLRGLLLGVGAGVGQGLGLVLSRLGMDAYAASIARAAQTQVVSSWVRDLIPFSATMMRGFAGLVGFTLVLFLARQGACFCRGLRNGRGLRAVSISVFFGPFVGVSLSLMAMQHAAAGVATTLMSLSPVLILLPTRFWRKQCVSRREWLGAAISVLGCAILFWQ